MNPRWKWHFSAAVGLLLVAISGSVQAQYLQQAPKLVGTAAVGASQQGGSVALSRDGNTAIVGGYNDDNDTGAAWVYVRRNGAWTQQGPKLFGLVVLLAIAAILINSTVGRFERYATRWMT